MENLVRSIGNYVVPVLFIVMGSIFTVKYISHLPVEIPNQPSGMLLGGVLLIVAGIVSMPFVQVFIGHKIAIVLAVVFAGASVMLYLGLWNTVEDEMEYQEALKEHTQGVVQRLKDIRAAETAYYQVKGEYTDNFDSLIAFINEPNIPVPFQLGGELNDSIGGGKLEAYLAEGFIIKQSEVDSVANLLSLDRDELWELIKQDKIAYKIRDTSYVSFYDVAFNDQKRMEHELPKVHLDSLPYNPFTHERFIARTSSMELSRGLRQSTIVVKDPTPFGRDNINMKRDTLMFGSLTEAHTDGNWKKLE